MDQACAFGPGRPVLLTFDGDTLDVEPLDRVAADVHIVVADLEASKDTVVILGDEPRSPPPPRATVPNRTPSA